MGGYFAHCSLSFSPLGFGKIQHKLQNFCQIVCQNIRLDLCEHTFHSVQVVALAEAHTVMVTEAVEAMVTLVAITMVDLQVMETMASKGKSK